MAIEDKVFGVAIRKDIVHEVIRYQRHMARQPKKTKRKSEISGSNKKPRPQKGGGVSQAGHKRNSVWRGGQKAHGPVLRDYSIGMNRKVRAMGMMIALAAKLHEGNLIVFDKIACEVGVGKCCFA
jgi:large subunit ribosomal protein L4